MGSIFGSSKAASPPAPVYNSYKDEVNGVQQVPVVNPDGSVTYVTSALPLTAEQQAEKDQLTGIKQGALADITNLSSDTYQPDAATQASLNDYRTQGQKTLDQQFFKRTTAEETDLARRGLQDSSAGESIQRQRRLDEQDAETNLDQQVSELGSQIRSNQLSLAQNLYALVSQSQNADEAKQYQAAIASQSRAASADAQRQASLLDYYSRVNSSSSSPLASTISNSLGDLFGSLKLLAG